MNQKDIKNIRAQKSQNLRLQRIQGIKQRRTQEKKQPIKQENYKNKQKSQNYDSQISSSETQQLNKSLQLKKNLSEHSIQIKSFSSQENLNEQQAQLQPKSQTHQEIKPTKQQTQRPKTAVQLAYDKRPYLKGARRYFKDGEVYYRTATKFFQPQKHYFHHQQSSIIKTWLYGNGKTTPKFLISSWNINGIRNALHKPSICNYIKNTNPDILCMIQVKINQYNYRQRPVKIPGYEGYWNFCKCSSGYSGIAIFSKFQPISAFQDFQERQFSQQGRVLTLEFQKFYLVAAYIPTAGQNLQRLEYKVNQFQKVFYKHCTKLLNKKHVIVAGDLNVCHTVLDMHVPKIIRKHQGKHPSSTKKQKTNFENFLNVGFVDTFRRLNPGVKKYSWYNIKRLGREKNLGKRLDYFLVNEQFMGSVVSSEVLSDVQGSDHCPIELNVDLSKLQKQGDQKRRAKYEMREEYISRHFIPQGKLEIKKTEQKGESRRMKRDQQNVGEVKKQDIF